MKKVVFPKVTFSLKYGDELREGSPAEQLLALLLASPPVNGQAFTIAEMRQRGPIIDKLEALKGSAPLLLEEAEHTLLAAILENATWGGYNRGAVALGDALRDAEEAQVQEKK